MEMASTPSSAPVSPLCLSLRDTNGDRIEFRFSESGQLQEFVNGKLMIEDTHSFKYTAADSLIIVVSLRPNASDEKDDRVIHSMFNLRPEDRLHKAAALHALAVATGLCWFGDTPAPVHEFSLVDVSGDWITFRTNKVTKVLEEHINGQLRTPTVHQLSYTFETSTISVFSKAGAPSSQASARHIFRVSRHRLLEKTLVLHTLCVSARVTWRGDLPLPPRSKPRTSMSIRQSELSNILDAMQQATVLRNSAAEEVVLENCSKHSRANSTPGNGEEKVAEAVPPSNKNNLGILHHVEEALDEEEEWKCRSVENGQWQKTENKEERQLLKQADELPEELEEERREAAAEKNLKATAWMEASSILASQDLEEGLHGRSSADQNSYKYKWCSERKLWLFHVGEPNCGVEGDQQQDLEQGFPKPHLDTFLMQEWHSPEELTEDELTAKLLEQQLTTDSQDEAQQELGELEEQLDQLEAGLVVQKLNSEPPQDEAKLLEEKLEAGLMEKKFEGSPTMQDVRSWLGQLKGDLAMQESPSEDETQQWLEKQLEALPTALDVQSDADSQRQLLEPEEDPEENARLLEEQLEWQQVGMEMDEMTAQLDEEDEEEAQSNLEIIEEMLCMGAETVQEAEKSQEEAIEKLYTLQWQDFEDADCEDAAQEMEVQLGWEMIAESEVVTTSFTDGTTVDGQSKTKPDQTRSSTKSTESTVMENHTRPSTCSTTASDPAMAESWAQLCMESVIRDNRSMASSMAAAEWFALCGDDDVNERLSVIRDNQSTGCMASSMEAAKWFALCGDDDE